VVTPARQSFAGPNLAEALDFRQCAPSLCGEGL
jgi:hypothetical protein